VETEGARVRIPVRRAASSYPASDGPRVEVRLQLSDGLSFVERVGFRYCVDKSLRASAAAVYWRTVDRIHQQRRWMAHRLGELHREQPEVSFRQAREQIGARLRESETVVYRILVVDGNDRFERLPARAIAGSGRCNRSCGFPSPVETLREIGARDWLRSVLRARRHPKRTAWRDAMASDH